MPDNIRALTKKHVLWRDINNTTVLLLVNRQRFDFQTWLPYQSYEFSRQHKQESWFGLSTSFLPFHQCFWKRQKSHGNKSKHHLKRYFVSLHIVSYYVLSHFLSYNIANLVTSYNWTRYHSFALQKCSAERYFIQRLSI